jgi:hypothetical protein
VLEKVTNRIGQITLEAFSTLPSGTGIFPTVGKSVIQRRPAKVMLEIEKKCEIEG